MTDVWHQEDPSKKELKSGIKKIEFDIAKWMQDEGFNKEEKDTLTTLLDEAGKIGNRIEALGEDPEGYKLHQINNSISGVNQELTSILLEVDKRERLNKKLSTSAQ